MTRRPAGLASGLAAACRMALSAAPVATMAYTGLAIVGGILPVALAWLTKRVLDGVLAGMATTALAAVGIGLLAVSATAATVPQASQFVHADLERKVGLAAHERLFTAVSGLVGLARFEDPPFLDRLRLAQQAGTAAPVQVLDGAVGLGRATVTAAGFLGTLLVINPVMAVLVLAAGMPTLVAELALSRHRARMHWQIGPIERWELFYAGLLASVEAAKEVRVFGLASFLRGRMLTERRRADAAKRVMDRKELLVQGGLGLTGALLSGGGLLWAVVAARNGQLSIGDVTVFIAAVAGIQGSLLTLAGNIARSHLALLMFGHFREVVTGDQDLPVAASPRALPPLRQGIELLDVWFRYSPEHPWILRGVSLRLRSGEAVALVGLNGAGKSTLVKLLCRFYDPTAGAILWDGVDLREVDPQALRERIGAAFQDHMDYDLTAAENIGLGDLERMADPQRVRDAAARAGVHDVLVSLPYGYETLLTRNHFAQADGATDPRAGVVLSGGQWQRLALARAFLRQRCDLMILDEPSAGLDAQAEHDIHTSLQRHRAGRTSLLISHRLGAIREADRIVVLHDGRVAEQGRHAELLAAGSHYARLFRLQAHGYRADDLSCQA